jgi:hypothetical protein
METMESLLGMLQNAAGSVRRKLEQGGVPPEQREIALRSFFQSREFSNAAEQFAGGLAQMPTVEPLEFTPYGESVGVDLSSDECPVSATWRPAGPAYVDSLVVSALLQPGYFNRGWTEEEIRLWLPTQNKYRGAGLPACRPFQREYFAPRFAHCFFPDPPFSRWIDESNEVGFPALQKSGNIVLFPIKKKMRKNDLVVLQAVS